MWGYMMHMLYIHILYAGKKIALWNIGMEFQNRMLHICVLSHKSTQIITIMSEMLVGKYFENAFRRMRLTQVYICCSIQCGVFDLHVFVLMLHTS